MSTNVHDATTTAKVVPHLTPEERAARGKAARAEVPRSSHAGWEPPPLRHDPVALLEQQARTRVPELVPIRYGRMLVSPARVVRGGLRRPERGGRCGARRGRARGARGR